MGGREEVLPRDGMVAGLGRPSRTEGSQGREETPFSFQLETSW